MSLKIHFFFCFPSFWHLCRLSDDTNLMPFVSSFTEQDSFVFQYVFKQFYHSMKASLKNIKGTDNIFSFNSFMIYIY